MGQYLKFLRSLSTRELQDYLEQVWHGDIVLTKEQEEIVKG